MNLRPAVPLLLPALLLAAAGCAVQPVTKTAAPGTVTCDYRPGGTPAKPVDPPEWQQVSAEGTVPVTFDLGDVKLQAELDRSLAPCTVNSFVSLATQGYYTGTSCHRLATSGIFILQCGDPTGTGRGTPGYAFNDEVSPDTTYPAGAIADRMNKQLVIGVGLLVFAMVYLGLGLTQEMAVAWLLLAGYGVYTGITDGVGKAWISGLLPADAQGTGQGVFQGVLGGGVLLAGVWAGLAWGVEGQLPLILSGVVAAAIAVFLLAAPRAWFSTPVTAEASR